MVAQMSLFDEPVVRQAPAPNRDVVDVGAHGFILSSTPVPPQVLSALAKHEWRDGRLVIPVDLGRDLYKEVDKILKAFGGRWKSGKNAGTEFKIDPSAGIAAVLEHGRMPLKNPAAFFPTPDSIIDDMIREANLFAADGFSLLEPSAGHGAIARRARAECPGLDIQCVELLTYNQEKLAEEGFDVWPGDFLDYHPDKKFFWILMNPPFSSPANSQLYIDHIYHAYSLLDKPNGTLLSVVPLGWKFRSDKKSQAFYRFVADRGEVWENPPDAFKESGTSIQTLTIKLTADPWRQKPRSGFPNDHVYQFLLAVDSDYDLQNRLVNNVVNPLATRPELIVLEYPTAEMLDAINLFIEDALDSIRRRNPDILLYIDKNSKNFLVQYFMELADEEKSYLEST